MLLGRRSVGVLGRVTGLPNSIVWLFLDADEPTCPPRWDWREAPCGRPGACDGSGSDAPDSKIFLTVFYEYRYKLSCIVNVTGTLGWQGLDPNGNREGGETMRFFRLHAPDVLLCSEGT